MNERDLQLARAIVEAQNSNDGSRNVSPSGSPGPLKKLISSEKVKAFR